MGYINIKRIIMKKVQSNVKAHYRITKRGAKMIAPKLRRNNIFKKK